MYPPWCWGCNRPVRLNQAPLWAIGMGTTGDVAASATIGPFCTPSCRRNWHACQWRATPMKKEPLPHDDPS